MGSVDHAPDLSRRARLGSRADVLQALGWYHDVTRHDNPSLLRIDPDRKGRGPFGSTFLARVEEHEELVRRLRRLPSRERLLLLLWYTEQWQVSRIAERLGISRMHCYRLRERALEAILA
jgi:RNA polymerase sigma factor (sigma-70 family)